MSLPPPPDPSWNTHAQVIRTIPKGFYPFAPEGIHGIYHAITTAIRGAQRFVYLENQYIWAPEVMDALLVLEFPKDYFDLVNVRFATSFLRTWNWPKLLSELQRVTRPGGVIRLSEYERLSSNDPATLRILQLAGESFYGAGHLFSEGKIEDTYVECVVGVAHDLARLLDQYGVKNVQTRRSMQECPIGTPEGESFAEDFRLGFRGLMPFIRKWRGLPDDYETTYSAMLDAMERPDYVASWSVITAWGTKAG